MNNKKLGILAVIAGIMVLWAVAQSRLGGRGAGVDVSPAGTYLIQGLEPGKIASLEIGSGENPVKLNRQGDIFVVSNKEDYPAESSKINKLIIDCLDIQILELITSDPANFDELQVSRENSSDVVKFLNQADKVITGVIFGKGQPKTEAKYVRLVTGDNVYTAKDLPEIDDSPMDYINRQIVNLDSSDIKKATIDGPNDIYTLRRVVDNNGTRLVLDNMPEGMKLSEPNCQELLSALSYLNFNDVKKESSLQAQLDFDSNYVAETVDFIRYSFALAEHGGKTYLKCRAQYTGSLPDPDKSEVASEEQLSAYNKAVTFNETHKGWVYEIADWKSKKFTKALDGILEKQQSSEEAEQETEEVTDSNIVMDSNSAGGL